jgi:hypothetical protein
MQSSNWTDRRSGEKKDWQGRGAPRSETATSTTDGGLSRGIHLIPNRPSLSDEAGDEGESSFGPQQQHGPSPVAAQQHRELEHSEEKRPLDKSVQAPDCVYPRKPLARIELASSWSVTAFRLLRRAGN